MRIFFQAIALAILFSVIGVVPGGIDTARADLVGTQAPCREKQPGGKLVDWCGSFSNKGTYVVRAFKFSPRFDGETDVNFNGSLACLNSGDQPSRVEIDAQITTNQDATPRAYGTAGLRYVQVLNARQGDLAGTDSFNLHATDAMGIDGGEKVTFYYLMRVREIGKNTTCYIFDAAFVVRHSMDKPK